MTSLPLHNASAPPALAPEVVVSDLRIGDLAKVTGKTARALRLYEEMGLLHPGKRTGGGYRLYDGDAVDRVHWIGKLQDLGLSLTDIQAAVATTADADLPREAMEHVQSLLQQKLRDVAAQMDRLQQVRREAAEALAYLEVCGTCESEVPGAGTCVECDEHDDEAPPLIIGLTRSAEEVRQAGEARLKDVDETSNGATRSSTPSSTRRSPSNAREKTPAKKAEQKRSTSKRISS